jgi:hypothetical protein
MGGFVDVSRPKPPGPLLDAMFEIESGMGGARGPARDRPNAMA